MSGSKRKPVGVLTQRRLHFKLTFATLLIIVGLALFTLYLQLTPERRENLRFGASLALGLTAVYSAFYVAAGFHYRNKQEAVARSLALLGEITSYEFTKVRMELEATFDQATVPPTALYERIATDVKVHPPVIFLLNSFEHVAFLVRLGHVDEETLYLSLNYLLPYWVRTFKPYIDERRRRRSSSALYTDAESLSAAWSSGHLLTTGEKVEVALS